MKKYRKSKLNGSKNRLCKKTLKTLSKFKYDFIEDDLLTDVWLINSNESPVA